MYHLDKYGKRKECAPKWIVLVSHFSLEAAKTYHVFVKKEMTQGQSTSTGQMNSKWRGDTCSDRPQEFHGTSFEQWCRYQASHAPLLRISVCSRISYSRHSSVHVIDYEMLLLSGPRFLKSLIYHQGYLHNLQGLMQNENVHPLIQNYWEFQNSNSGALN